MKESGSSAPPPGKSAFAPGAFYKPALAPTPSSRDGRFQVFASARSGCGRRSQRTSNVAALPRLARLQGVRLRAQAVRARLGLCDAVLLEVASSSCNHFSSRKIVAMHLSCSEQNDSSALRVRAPQRVPHGLVGLIESLARLCECGAEHGPGLASRLVELL